jgi:rfaE bifunctional protein kinase chain/domain
VKYTKTEIKNIFKGFDNKKILIVGDVMVDSYWWGSVNRISPEAPVPVVLVNKREYRLGGAANVAMNIHQLGAQAKLFSVIGKDLEGNIFKTLLKDYKLSGEFILQTDNRPTTVKSRIIANELQQLIRVDSETDAFINNEDSDHLLKLYTNEIKEADAVILQDYDKGVLSRKLITEMIDLANENQVPTIIDPKKRNFGSYRKATLFKPNLKELKEGLGITIPKPISKEKMREATQKIIDKMGVKIAFITLSENGVYINNGEEDFLIPTHKRSIYDVSGAGDTVASVAAIALASGLPIENVASLSNIAGGLVCEKVGVVPIEKEEFLKESLTLLA